MLPGLLTMLITARRAEGNRRRGHGSSRHEHDAESVAGLGNGLASTVCARDEAALDGRHGNVELETVKDERPGDAHRQLHIPHGHLAALRRVEA